MNSFRKFLYDKLITHGWQVPVRMLVKYEDMCSSYSYMGQVGQDKIVLNLLNHKEKGYFIELGGSNGVTSSNTYVLEKKYHWDGICIEANQSFYKQLVKNRNCIKVNALISDDVKTVKFNNDGSTGQIDTHGQEMRTTPLSQILIENEAPKVIDYLSLDVEGHEEAVLYNFPFEKFKFRVMSIERPSDKLNEKLLSIGYTLHQIIKPNGFWLDNIYVLPELVDGYEGPVK